MIILYKVIIFSFTIDILQNEKSTFVNIDFPLIHYSHVIFLFKFSLKYYHDQLKNIYIFNLYKISSLKQEHKSINITNVFNYIIFELLLKIISAD